MSSAKGVLVRLLGGAFLRRASVAAAENVGGFRRILLRGGIPTPGAGTKVQILLPSDDVRTYSPIATPDGVLLLGWKHASGPGARWISEVQPGAEVRFAGPQRSLELPAGPVIVVGDETSVAVAASFEIERPGQVTALFQATDIDDTRAAAERVGLRPAAVIPRGTSGAMDAMAEAVASSHASAPRAVVALTGGSKLVLAIRSALRTRGLSNLKTKTYWIPGKRGLD